MFQHLRIWETAVVAVNVYYERGTTRTEIKVLKCSLSVKGLKVYVTPDRREVCLEAAILQRKRNSSPFEVTCPENVRG